MKRTCALAATSAAFVLVACGAPTEDEAAATSDNAQETTTITQAVSSEASEETAANTSATSPAESETAAASQATTTAAASEGASASAQPSSSEAPGQAPDDFQAAMAEQMRINGNIGDPFVIDGQETELCVHGDGFGLNVVTAGGNTTCEFTRNVMNSATAGLNPTGDNVRDRMPMHVRAASPVTNQTYDMNCSVDERKLITCTGGDNATAYMY
jgi:cobalamin biosynthesis Mg chelatase CobN